MWSNLCRVHIICISVCFVFAQLTRFIVYETWIAWPPFKKISIAGSHEKRQQTITTASIFGRSFEDSSAEEGKEPDDLRNQSLKDLAAGSTDAQIGTINLFGVPIVCLYVEGKERLCLAQISNTLLRDFSYNEIHNRRVALGITCMQCSPIQLEVLRRSGAMPVSSRRCGLITKREAERLVKSFLEDIPPPKLPENFSFQVEHSCGWGCQGMFMPSRYNSSRAKCIKCITCNAFFSPNKFIFHYHKTSSSSYRHPDAANFNSWRRHLNLTEKSPPETLLYAWEDVKAMFNGGCRKRTTGGKTNFSLSPTRTRESADFKSPVVQPMLRSYTGLQSSDLYRLNMADSMHSTFPVQSAHSSVASYGDMLRSMSLNYTPWWKSLYMQRHGVPPSCNIPFSPEFNLTNYGPQQFPLPILDATESFVDEMNKLSEMTSHQDKKEKKEVPATNITTTVENVNKAFSSCEEETVDIETNEKPPHNFNSDIEDQSTDTSSSKVQNQTSTSKVRIVLHTASEVQR